MPIVRDPLDPKISMWHFLAFYMRWWREKEGLSLAQCGQIMSAARSTVCNMEAGRQRPHDDQMRLLDKKYKTGVLFQLLLWYARTAHDPDWFRQYSQYETEGSCLRYFHGQAVPLPLQTDEYTWALVEASTSRNREDKMADRLARKKAILERESVPDIWILLDESVLIRQVGGPEVMKAQLVHLQKMATEPNVILRVVPFTAGATLGLDGSLQIISLEGRDIAYAGAQGGGRLIESPSEVRAAADKFDRIGAKAASEDGSLDIIQQYLERYE
ncbi:DUF5753 domain-containing protein [Spirillospora sp. NPDC029432]|uniref:DUF5753 domain-containing protein n=1 Tax=Spirillospora sp. NPDC029432 TaxID=3154599 RepID=UPI0034546FF9